MVNNLAAKEIYNFIIDDFKACWNSLANNCDPTINRGNFMFGRQAMNLLEFACRLYQSDPSGHARIDFSSELIVLNLSTLLPSPTTSTKGFILSHLGNINSDVLLWSLFDPIRHGLAHQYQQIIVDLNDGHHCFVQLTGASAGRNLNNVRTTRPQDHLGYFSDNDGDIGIINTNLIGRNLNFSHLSRRSQNKFYNFSTTDLINSLNQSGHTNISASTSNVTISRTSSIFPP
jgi:hypothetical protein